MLLYSSILFLQPLLMKHVYLFPGWGLAIIQTVLYWSRRDIRGHNRVDHAPALKFHRIDQTMSGGAGVSSGQSRIFISIIGSSPISLSAWQLRNNNG